MPIILLLILSSLLAEIFISHNMPPESLRQPVIWMWLVLFYGLPNLLIRETWRRFDLPMVSVVFLGIAYAIFNEGIIAKTLAQSSGAPVTEFVGYGIVGGINLPWAVVILTWHSLISVMLPILSVHFLLPEDAGRSWIGKKTFLALIGVNCSLYLFYFAGGSEVKIISPAHLLLYLGLTALIVGGAFRLKMILKKSEHSAGSPGFRFLAVTGSLIPTTLYFLAYAAATNRFFPWAVYVAIGLTLYVVFLQHIYAHQWSERQFLTFLLFFGIVFSMTYCLFTKSLSALAVSAIFACFAGAVLVSLRRQAAEALGPHFTKGLP